ncbi:MAG: LPP20 family lipoprotein [Thiomicrospira sp.]|uniref:LPP20 family lipoprotein n=1 Tax=Thiomicrospira sp. TaxID=935 RepID=UPI0019EF5361|nr:LPP20 family lipoprotein [Thiomicrospira sp.]MBE0492810.1 LPP20 family lipoprotein [Thiomicrospira sp.]
MVKNSLISLVVLFGLVGCASSPSKPPSSASQTAQPKPELMVPPDNQAHFYAQGFGESEQSAQQDALARIATRISVSVQSQTETNLSVTMRDGDEQVEQDFRNRVLTQTKAIDFVGVSLLDQQRNAGQVEVVVSVNRQALIQSYQNKLNQAQSQLRHDFELYKQTSLFEQLKNKPTIMQQSAELMSTLSVMQVLQPTYKPDAVISLNQTLYVHMSQQQQAAVFSIQADQNSQALAQLIEQQLTTENYKLSNTGANVRIQLSTQTSPMSVRTTDARIASLKMVNRDSQITVTDVNNRTVSTVNMKARGVSSESEQAAIRDTTAYSRLMQGKSIIEFLSGQ